jgi:DNA-binding MarR family transcriptional regulator
MGDTPWLDDREADAWRGFLRMQMHLEASLARQLATDSGLSHQDYGVLVALSEHPDGRIRLFELAETLGWEKSRASHHVSRMAARGLVDKEPCDEDRRGAFVVLTPQGRSSIEEAAPGHVRTVRELFIDRLTPAQLDELRAMSATVLAGLGVSP